MAINTCPGCASSNPADFDDSNGSLICTNCGTVLNDSQIVSEISFGETSSGAAIVQGSYVAEGQTHVGGGGKFRSGTSLESREQAIQAGQYFHSCSYVWSGVSVGFTFFFRKKKNSAVIGSHLFFFFLDVGFCLLAFSLHPYGFPGHIRRKKKKSIRY